MIRYLTARITVTIPRWWLAVFAAGAVYGLIRSAFGWAAL